MSKYSEASKTMVKMLCNIKEFFECDDGGLEIDTSDGECLIVCYTTTPSFLSKKKFSSPDFKNFCKQNELSGVIYFNDDNTVSFSMTPA